MTELGAAIAGLEAAFVRVDGVLAHASKVGDSVSTSGLDLVASAGKVRDALGPALPDHVGEALNALPTAGSVTIRELATARAELARLGAVARGVDQLGGVDQVVAQGGLDAIDGAAGIVQGHLIADGKRQLAPFAGLAQDAPTGMFSGKGARSEWLRRLQARSEAGRETITRGGGLSGAGAPDLDSAMSDYRLDRDSFGSTVDAVRRWLGATPNASPGAATAAWVENNLVSSEAQVLAVQRAMGEGHATEPLVGMAPEAALEAAPIALDKHIGLMEKLVERVGDASYSSDQYGQAVRAMRAHIAAAVEDARALHAILGDGPDKARNAAYLVDDWGSYLIANAGKWGHSGNGSKMLPTTLEQLRALREQVARVADDPQLLHAGTDAAAEVRSILERPGALDVAALRAMFDGDAPRATKHAIAAMVADLKPHLPEAPSASSVDEARRLLEESALISEAVGGTIGKEFGREEPLLLNDASVKAAVEDLLLRRRAALGVAERVPEQFAGSLRTGMDGIAKKLETYESQWSHELPNLRDLESVDTSAKNYLDQLVKVTDRASADGGLRAIPPSARPSQAREAQARWLMRELDSLPPVAVDAPPESHVDSTARRLTLIADLLGASGVTRYGGGSPDGNVIMRAGSEIMAIDDLWRYPDDTALRLAYARRVVEAGSNDLNVASSTFGADSKLPDALRQSAADLRAWSALPDGTLPHTSIDRISVAARRSDALRLSSAREVYASSDSRAKDLTSWLDDVDQRLADLDTVMGGAMPRAERTALDDSLAAVRSNLAHYGELQKTYKGSDWQLNTETLQHARERIGELDDAISGVQADARATDAERLAW